jgi:DNA modification methylase
MIAAGNTNRLFYGDNLEVLRQKIATESVDLCYIDPPFNSKRTYFQIYNNQGKEDLAQAQAFEDSWEWGDEAVGGLAYITDVVHLQSSKFTNQTVELIRGLRKVLREGSLLAYLVHMTLRIVEIRRVLKETGSFYLHCDPTASHYLKLVCDSVFCGDGGDFRNEIVWLRTNSHNMPSKGFAKQNDIILFYTKSREFTFNQQYLPYGEAQLSRFKADATGRLYKAENLTFSTANPSRQFEWRGSKPPAHRSWGADLSTLEKWLSEGLILLKKNGKPRLDGLKIYLDDTKGKPCGTNWTDIPRIGNTSGERLGYQTQKPEALLERIIKSSSNEGDVVLDAYCGCGTTVAVAQRLKRPWIGIDITYQSISLILKRLRDTYPAELANIEKNIQLDGVPRDMESAIALAHRKDDKTRKEFEKWAVLTYSNNQSQINNKKGADAGIDGIAYFMVDSDTNGKAIFQVKSGGANRATMATLNSDRQSAKAEFGILITMNKPTPEMLNEVGNAGKYKHPLLNREDDRLQIVTIKEILDGKRLNLPMARIDAAKSAEPFEDETKQAVLPFNSGKIDVPAVAA